MQARRRRAWTERALLHGSTPDPHPAGEGADSPQDQGASPHDDASLQPEPEQLAATGSAQSGLEAASPDPEPNKGRETAAGHGAAAATAARTPEQGAKPCRVAAGDSLRRAAIANSRAPKPTADGGADSPAGKALGAQPRAATASEGSEAPKSSAAGSGVGIAGGRSKTLPAAASPARFAVHARAVPGPPRWSPQDGTTGNTRACSAADYADGASASGAACSDVEAQSGGRPFLHRLPTPFSAAAPPAASPGRSRADPAAADQRPQPRGRSGSLGSAALPRHGTAHPRSPNPGSPAGMRRWESGTSWVLERLWDFFLAPAPSGAMARAGSDRGLPGDSAVPRGHSGDAGDAGEGRGGCGSTVEGSGGSALRCTTPLARSISQRFPAFLTPTGLAGKVHATCA